MPHVHQLPGLERLGLVQPCGTDVAQLPAVRALDGLGRRLHGNNINQIARSVNAGIARAEDAKRGLYLLDQVYELMYQIAKK
jgi:hypothetical protein